MAEIVAKMDAHVVAVGEAGDEDPSVTLGTEDGDVLVFLRSIEECRALAPLLGRDIEITIAIPLPEKGRRRG